MFLYYLLKNAAIRHSTMFFKIMQELFVLILDNWQAFYEIDGESGRLCSL